MFSRLRYYAFDDIRAAGDCAAFAHDIYGVEIRHGRCAAAWCGGDNPEAVSIERDKWFDHVRKIGGGILELAAYKFGGDIQQAQEFLGQHYHLEPKRVAGAAPERRKSRYDQLLADGYTVAARYDYRNVGGQIVHFTFRLQHPEKPKEFVQGTPNTNGRGHRWGLKGVETVLYRLPEIAESSWVILCEGEKSADRLAGLGLPSTTAPMGAGKWSESYSEALRGKDVAVFPDNDEPGREHAQLVARALHGIAASVRIIEDHSTRPKGGIDDWLDEDGGHGSDDVLALISAAPEWNSTSDVPPEQTRATGTSALRTHASPKGDLILNPPDYHGTARFFVRGCHTLDGIDILRHHASEFRRYTGTHYKAMPADAMRAKLWEWLAAAKKHAEGPPGKKKKLEPYLPSTNSVNNVLDAVKAVTNLPSDIQPPAWLSTSCPYDAIEVVGFKNELLHLPSGSTMAHTPHFFSTNSLPFDYQPDATCPAWHEFLAALWPDDQGAIEALQLAFGYLLGGQTHLQKIFLLVGPKRSGKGTIGRVLNKLMGPDACCGPTLAGLAIPFGLQSLINKRLAVISDARLSGRTDQAVITERLLTISGEDSITIQRKYDEDWHGTLGVRFLLLSNELPRLSDSSGALASRFIVWTLKRTFFGREDFTLTRRLLKELPGIANWSVAGWRRLQDVGSIDSPASSRNAVDDLQDLGSPISAFIRDQCIVGPDHEVERQRLYEAWCSWCTAEGRQHAGTAESFGRDLRAALPELDTTQHRVDGHPTRFHRGVALGDHC
jgi:putative DNA primase/helicase